MCIRSFCHSCTTYITVCQDVYNLYAGLGDCVVRSLHAYKYPGNVTEWRYLGVCKSGQSYTRVDKGRKIMQTVICGYTKCANVGRDIQECAEVYSGIQYLAHLISQRWLCSKETHTRCCHGFQFLSLRVKGEREVR